MPSGFLHPWYGALHQTCWGPYFKTLICPCFEIHFLQKPPQFGAFPVFESSYLSHGKLLNQNILSHYYFTHIKHNFEKGTYITNEAPRLVAKTFIPNFGFAPDCWYHSIINYNMMLDTIWQLQMYNTDRTLNSQMASHNSPSRASYGLTIVIIFRGNWPCYNKPALS